MKKLVFGLILITVCILSGCQTRTTPESITPTPSTSEPTGSWEIGGNLSYSQEPIWGDTLVGLGLDLVNSESKDGQIPRQNIIVYDLKTREQKQVIKVPELFVRDSPSIYGNKIVFSAIIDRDDFFRQVINASPELGLGHILIRSGDQPDATTHLRGTCPDVSPDLR